MSLVVLRKTAQRQELVLRRQIRELHRLVGVQRLLHGVDPLTGLAATVESTKVSQAEKHLLTLLDEQGGIAMVDCVDAVMNVMRRTGPNSSGRKLLVLVLDKTRDKMPCLAKFVKVGGLGVLCTWLGDAAKANKAQLTMKILKLLPSRVIIQSTGTSK